MDSFDPIALIDRGYLPQPSADAWLDAMAPHVSAPFDVDGFGVGAYYIVDGMPGQPIWVENPTSPIDAATAGEILRGPAAALTPEQLRAFALAVCTPGVASLADVFGELPLAGIRDDVVIRDSVGIVVNTVEGRRAVFGGMHRRRLRLDAPTRALWRRIAVHLAAGCRLAGRSPEGDDVEAVISPEGKVVHATGRARSREARDVVRNAVVRRDRARMRSGRADPWAALELWHGLTSGRWTLVDHFDHDGRRFVLARRNDPQARGPSALTRRQRQVVFYASLGWSRKEVGYALGLGETTVSTHLTHALRRLGLASRAELVRLGVEIASAVEEATRETPVSTD